MLVIAAHPDAAELAVGATLAGLVARGVEATVMVLALSEQRELAEMRRSCAERAAGIIGHELCWGSRSDSMQVIYNPAPDLVAEIDKTVGEIDPSIVLTHWAGDSHEDHVMVARAVIASSRRWPSTALYSFRPSELRTPAAVRFHPNIFVESSLPALEKKYRALEEYEYEGQGFRALDLESHRSADHFFGVLGGFRSAEPLKLVRRSFALRDLGCLH